MDEAGEIVRAEPTGTSQTSVLADDFSSRIGSAAWTS
jgi:hypothetical protein